MKPWKTILATATVIILIWVLYEHRHSLGKDAIIAYGKSLPAAGLIVGFLVLPLVGFPLSIFLVLAGIRFGFPGGAAVTTVCIFFHHFVAHRLSQGQAGDRIRNFAVRQGHRLPEMKVGSSIWATILFTSLHGPPYALKLYLLALTGLPFWIYCYVGATVYTLFGLIPVAAAAAAAHVDVTWIYVSITAVSLGALIGKYYKHKQEPRGD